MKKHYFIISTILCLSLGIKAQTTRELMSTPDFAVAISHYNFFDGYYNRSLAYTGDTILCADTLLVFSWAANPQTKAMFRVDSSKVYYVEPANCSSYLLFDFNLSMGDTFDATNVGGGRLRVLETGTRPMLNGTQRRYLKLQPLGSTSGFYHEWVEGLGYLSYGLLPAFFDFEGNSTFVCASDSSGLLLTGSIYTPDLCDSLSCLTPSALFEASTNGPTATFQNLSQNADNYLWDFGDGATSTEAHPQHTYTSEGCYRVTLWTNSHCLSQRAVKSRTIPVCITIPWMNVPLPDSSAQGPADIFFVNGQIGWAAESGSLYKTTDGGNNWSKVTLPLGSNGSPALAYKVHMLNQDTGVLRCTMTNGLEQYRLLYTTDGGDSWAPHLSNESTHTDVTITNTLMASASLYDTLFVSADRGQTWNKLPYAIPGLISLYHIVNVFPVGDAIGAIGFAEVFQPTYNRLSLFFKTTPDGQAWEINSIIDGFSGIIFDADFPDEQNGWIVGYEGKVLHTTNGGFSWDIVPVPSSAYLSEVDFTDVQNGWITGFQETLLHTTDGGTTWEFDNCGLSNSFSYLSAVDSNTAFLSGTKRLIKYQGSNILPCIFSSATETAQPISDWKVVPNPAAEYVEFIPGPSSFLPEPGDLVRVYNQLGNLCAEQNLTGSSAFVDVRSLPDGYYVAHLVRQHRTLGVKGFVVHHR